LKLASDEPEPYRPPECRELMRNDPESAVLRRLTELHLLEGCFLIFSGGKALELLM
jgi:hypothetical protein